MIRIWKTKVLFTEKKRFDFKNDLYRKNVSYRQTLYILKPDPLSGGNHLTRRSAADPVRPGGGKAGAENFLGAEDGKIFFFYYFSGLYIPKGVD